MDKTIAAEIDISAILSTYVYMDQQDVNYRGKTLKEILEMMPKPAKNSGEYKAVLKAISENEELGEIRLISQSSKEGFSDSLIIACAFEDANGNVYVSYRGTGDGKWVDNGVGLAKETVMQKEANRYFEHVIEEAKLIGYDKGKIIVTGHSKGGNEAQYVTLNSKYGYLIDNCYSFDGQGFPQKEIDRFKELYGGDYYEEQVKKMYSINGDNDYVHGQGVPVISDTNKYFIKTDAKSIEGYHDIKKMLRDDGTGINWTYKDGEIVSAEQGDIGKLSYVISEKTQELDEEVIEDSAVSIMALLEALMPYTYYDENGKKYKITGGKLKVGTGDVATMSQEEWIGFLAHGLPKIIETMIGTGEGRQVAFDMLKSLYADTFEEKGFIGVVSLTFGIIVSLPVAAIFVEILVFVCNELEIISNIIKQITEIPGKIKKWFSEFKNAIINTVNKINVRVKDWSYGGRYASANPQIIIDTYKIRNYASRLNSVNRRISNLDERLDSLYWRVGLLDLLNLMTADILTSYNSRLLRAASYLNDTAIEFETVERELSNC